MDFLDFAKEIETQGLKQYTQLANTLQVEDLKGIFTFMADQERRHYEVFDSWQRNGKVTPELSVETVYGMADEAFKHLASHFMAPNFVAPSNYEQAYKQALDFENKSVSLYQESLGKFDGDDRQSVLQSIIEQEKAHANFIIDVMAFLRHPGEWLENAEWHHQEEF